MKNIVTIITVCSLILFSCQKENNNTYKLQNLDRIDQIDDQIFNFFKDVKDILQNDSKVTHENLADRLSARGYEMEEVEVSLAKNSADPLETEFQDYTDNVDDFIHKLSESIGLYKNDYVDNNSEESLMTYTRLVGIKAAADLYKESPEVFNQSKNKCASAILGGFLSGGLSGCAAGVEIGVWFGPSGAAGGCVLAGFTSAVGAALLGASKYCKKD